jgi:lipopolysaccharide export system permease protein
MQSTVLVLAVLVALFAFLSFLGAVDDYGKGRFGLYEVVKYVVLTLPGWIYALFPVTALLGSILGLSWLASGSEITAMRAAGVSLSRIEWSVMKTGLVLVAVGVLIGETVVPVSETRAQRERAEELEIGLHREKTGLWLREGDSFVNIGEVLPDRSLLQVNIYRFDDNVKLRDNIAAARARYQGPEAGSGESTWQLQDVTSSWLDKNGVTTRKAARFIWRSSLTPDVVGVFSTRPEALSSWQLYRYIRHLRRNFQKTDRYRLAFWNKLLLPFATAVMVLLAVPFVIGQDRSGGTGKSVLVGIMLALAFVVLNQGFGHFSLLIGLPPLLGASLPILLFLGLAIYLLRRAG